MKAGHLGLIGNSSEWAFFCGDIHHPRLPDLVQFKSEFAWGQSFVLKELGQQQAVRRSTV